MSPTKIENSENQDPTYVILNSLSTTAEPQIIKKTQNIYVAANFGTDIIEIGYVFLATGEQKVVSVSNGNIHLLQGRMYFIPIGKEDIDSDEYNIKVDSSVADRFDIRYIRDGLAAVVSIRHNAILKNGEKLCILTPLNL